MAGQAIDLGKSDCRRHEDRMVGDGVPGPHRQGPHSPQQRARDLHAPIEQRNGRAGPLALEVALQAQVVRSSPQHLGNVGCLGVVADRAGNAHGLVDVLLALGQIRVALGAGSRVEAAVRRAVGGGRRQARQEDGQPD